MLRLGEFEQGAIRSLVSKFLPTAEIYLFGSRVDANKKGGDIDILVYTPNQVEPNLELRLRIKAEILESIGEQKLDMIFTNDLKKTPFIELAMLEAVKL